MTNHPVDVIKKLGLSTSSIARAVTEYGERNYSIKTHLANANEITGGDFSTDNVKIASIITKYAIELTLKAFQENDFPDMDALSTDVRKHTDSLISEYPMFVQEYTSSDDNGSVTASKKRSQRGGWQGSIDLYLANKDSLTRNELVDMMVDKLNIPKSTAMAYWYKLVKEYGYRPKEGEKTRKKKT